MSDVLIKGGDFGHGHRHTGRTSCEDRGKDMSNTAVNQEMTRMLATTRSHEETRKNSTQTLGTMSK